MRSARSVRAALSAVLLAGFVNGIGCVIAQRYVSYGLWRSAARLIAQGSLAGMAVASLGILAFALIGRIGARTILPADPSEPVGARRENSTARPLVAVGSCLGSAALGFTLVRGGLLLAPSLRYGPLAGLFIVSLLPGIAAALMLVLSIPSSRLRAVSMAGAALAAACAAAVAAGGLYGAARPWAPKGAPDILVISIDTLRADRLGCYGYSRETSPNLDRLASVSYRFVTATSQATNTDPSHASMLSGLDPPRHGNTLNGHVLAARILTLPEILRDHGYRTAAVIGGTTLKARHCGLQQGFDDYDDRFPEGHRPAEDVTDRAIERLSRLDDPAASFLFVHYYDVHGPYTPPAGYREFFAGGPPPPGGDRQLDIDDLPRYQRIDGQTSARFYLDGYDGEIRRVDAEIGRLLEGLRRARRDGRTWIIVLSDHGETLLERQRQFNHGALLTEEQIHIPLIVRPPAGSLDRQVVISEPAQATDVTPFVLDVAGIATPPGLAFDGRSFRARLSAGPPEVVGGNGESGIERPSLGVARCARWQLPGFPVPLDQHGLVSCLRTSRFKLVRFPTPSGPYYQLFDLREDAGEKTDVGSSHPELVRAFAPQLDSWLASGPATAASGRMDRETREMLRSLGYVE